jgi:hypothetical protein
MDSRFLKMAAMVGLVLVAALAFWFLRGPVGGTDEGPDEDTTAADRGSAGTASHSRSDSTTRVQPHGAVGDVAGSSERPTIPLTLPQVTDLDVAAADAAGQGAPDDERYAEYIHPPAEVLQTRVMAATTALPEGRKIEGVTILCLTGGTDCRVSAVAPTPQDVRTFAETLEVTPAQDGEETAPTVEINSTESMSSGMTDFEMGVYYP